MGRANDDRDLTSADARDGERGGGTRRGRGARTDPAAHAHDLVGRRRSRAALHAGLAAFTLAMLYPVLWMIASSFKPERIIFTDFSLWPRDASLRTYVEGWTGLRGCSSGSRNSGSR